jgi:hypothetical protein
MSVAEHGARLPRLAVGPTAHGVAARGINGFSAAGWRPSRSARPSLRRQRDHLERGKHCRCQEGRNEGDPDQPAATSSQAPNIGWRIMRTSIAIRT